MLLDITGSYQLFKKRVLTIPYFVVAILPTMTQPNNLFMSRGLRFLFSAALVACISISCLTAATAQVRGVLVTGAGTQRINSLAAFDGLNKVAFTGFSTGDFTIGSQTFTSGGAKEFVGILTPNQNVSSLAFLPGASNVRLRAATNNQLIVIGAFVGSVTVGSTTLTHPGTDTATFVAWMNGNGQFVGAQKIAGAGHTVPTAVSTWSSADYAIVGGRFTTSISLGADTYTPRGSQDCFVAGVSRTGGVKCLRTMGSTIGEQISDISYLPTIGTNGFLIVIGSFQGKCFWGTQNVTSEGNWDAFGASYDIDTTSMTEVSNFTAGSSFIDKANTSLIIGNDLFVFGEFSMTATFGTLSLTSAGQSDIFGIKVDIATGNPTALMQYGGINYDNAHGVTTSAVTGGLYVATNYSGSAMFGGTTYTSNGGWDAGLLEVTNSLTTNSFADWGGSIVNDTIVAITRAASGVITASQLTGTVTIGGQTLTSNGVDAVLRGVGQSFSVEARANSLAGVGLYPVPSNAGQQMTLELPTAATVQVLDMAGRTISTFARNAGASTFQAPTAKGVYVLQITAETGATSLRFAVAE
jgi:hypothetical protein